MHLKIFIVRFSLFITICHLTISIVTAGNVLSQGKNEKNITLSLSDQPVAVLFEALSKQTGYSFLYDEYALSKLKNINIHLESATINEVLNQISRQTHLTFQKIDDTYAVIPPAEVKNTIKVQQGIRITGTVSDHTGELLPGVNVIVRGSTLGTNTDINGEFTLNVPSDTSVLQFSFMGYHMQEIVVGNRRIIAVTLREESSEIEEVTVVAFGKQKKESVIASITTISPTKLKVPSSNLTTSFAGNIAGIISYQRSGEPGQDNADFFVRGVTTFGYKTSPLILIDGIELSTNDLARIHTDDIASFSILKDATATALYGARGANGVILVTTKQGVEGKAKLNIRMENSWSMPTQNVKLADPVTYMRLANEAVLTRDPLGITRYSDKKIAGTEAGLDPIFYPANDWRKLLFKNYAMNQRVNLNIHGGGTVARYFVSASYSRDNGILKVDDRNNFNNNINLQKYTLRSNVNIDITKSTELIVRLSGNFDNYTGPVDGGSEMYNQVMHSNPVLFPAYYPASEQYKYVNHIMFGNYDQGQYMNPYAQMVKGYKDYNRSQMIAQLDLRQDLKMFTEGLSARAMLNVTRDSYYEISRAYNPYYYELAYYDPQTKEYQLNLLNEDTGSEYLGWGQGAKTVDSDIYVEAAVDYNRTFDEKHGISGLLVFILKDKMIADAENLQETLPYRNLGVSGRATYSYDSRYFAEFNFGYNGSERFHESHRFGFFPSAGLGWSISNEAFWKPIKKTVSNLKLRATYGLAGNDAIGSAQDRFFFMSIVNMNDASKSASFGENNGSYKRNGVTIDRYANDDITWEVSEKKNIALEIGLWNKVNIIAEYFTEYREKILMDRMTIPNTTGLNTAGTYRIRANTGEASGKGTDISIDYQQSWPNSLWLTARGNFTYATSQYEVYEEPTYDEYWRFHKGNALSQSFGYIAEKLFTDEAEVANSPTQFGDYKAGDIKYLDVNRDGVITEADKVPIGNPTVPEIVYGFGFSAGYKGFDLSCFFQGLANESFWIDYAATSPFYNETQLLKDYADNYWSEDSRNIYALWPRLSTTLISNNNQTNTWFMRDGAFLRLKQVEIGYTLPQKILDKLRATTLRIYFTGTNLFLLSKFKMWDVEMGGRGLGYPLQKTFNIGLNVSF
ncbi:MAG: TonB-dependent receptor [Bacteroidales bacterium]|jgi:TonB-linked SusC/RagA family outer membrane protein|nr:TonB-dependent receptor [Bacteroidales bacterium]